MRLLRHVLFLALLPFFCLLAAAQEQALKGVALVVGQSKYAHLAELPNPANDARAIAKLLTDLGFEVDQVNDGDAKKLAKSLRRFTEDADGADAAILYYSGHGIEAGGENWLVPVDADLDALGDASRSLVPISEVLNELKATVPIAVLLLDACRSNPFPAGALLKTEEKPEGVPLGGAGLSVPRGFTPVEGASTESLGTIIGFAAEPGLPALDGDAGGNSPYAAALIRHLSAMNGEEFGTVMRMVTEEVYLKTKAQQRPWVNESLRRQLYFGLAIDEPKGDDALITGERRKLLLTIAALPGPDRKRVETIAKSDGIPMDALYGVLRAMGKTDIPKDPASLEKVLFSQSAKIKDMLAERKSLDAGDPEILRLAAAADRAIDEGAIKTARGFLDQAKQKVKDTKTDIEDIEALVKEKRVANAALLEKSADAAALEFDHLAEAKDYAEAYDWVKDADAVLAWRYKNREADAWQDHGAKTGEQESFARALQGYDIALTLVPRAERPVDWAKSQNNRANTLQIIGKREADTKNLEAAIAAYRLALQEMTKVRSAKDWAQMQNNLGVALMEYGARANKSAALNQAAFALDLALDVRTREADPKAWAETQVNLGSLYLARASAEKGVESLTKAAVHLNLALEVLDKKNALRGWASAKNNLGIALRQQGERGPDPAKLQEAVRIYNEVVAAYPRDIFPIEWADAKNNLGIALLSVGQAQTVNDAYLAAIEEFRAAGEILTFDKSPKGWSSSKSMESLAWSSIAMRKSGTEEFEKAVAISEEVARAFPRETGGNEWAGAQLQIGTMRLFMGMRRQGKGDFEAAETALSGALDYYKSTNNKQFAEAANGALEILRGIMPPKQ
jgi:uncharacterized caspase-like protein